MGKLKRSYHSSKANKKSNSLRAFWRSKDGSVYGEHSYARRRSAAKNSWSKVTFSSGSNKRDQDHHSVLLHEIFEVILAASQDHDGNNCIIIDSMYHDVEHSRTINEEGEIENEPKNEEIQEEYIRFICRAVYQQPSEACAFE